MDGAVLAWAERVAREHLEVTRIGHFGSYARGLGGVLAIVVVGRSAKPFIRRAADFPCEELPVPADLLVYNSPMRERLQGKFRKRLEWGTIWVYERSVGRD